MWPDWVSNPGPLTYESGALPTGLRGPAPTVSKPLKFYCNFTKGGDFSLLLFMMKLSKMEATLIKPRICS